MESAARVMDLVTVAACTLSAALLCSTLAPHLSRDIAWALVALVMGAICLVNMLRSRAAARHPPPAASSNSLYPTTNYYNYNYNYNPAAVPVAAPATTATSAKFLAPAAPLRSARAPAALYAGKQAAAEAPVGAGQDMHTLSDGTVIDWDDVVISKSRHKPGYRSRMAGKTDTIGIVKSMLNDNDLVFSFPLPGISVSELKTLRTEMPANTSVKVIKNKLMERAMNEAGEEWSDMGPLLKESSVWVFTNQDNIKPTFESYDAWAKKMGDKAKGIKGAFMEGALYEDDASLKALRNLPTREDLMLRLAIALKSPTTRLARVLKQPARKVAVAIKLSSENEMKAGSDAATVTLKELEIVPNEPKPDEE